MRLDADDDAGEGRVEGGDALADFWGARVVQIITMSIRSGQWRYEQHGEQRLVGVYLRLNAARRIQTQLRAGLPKAAPVLRCCEHGDVKDLTFSMD